MTNPGRVQEALAEALAPRYSVERELGEGGMATVYLCRDLEHGREVAVKVLKPELAAALGFDRFRREIEVTARLDHPHVVPLLDSGEADGFLYYTMPYVKGESLRERLERERQLPIDEAVRIAREVASALDYAHERGVVHRDIKPENILLSAGHARVADFGVARAFSAAGGDRMTRTGFALGTAEYMSPEQAAAEEVDGRSDLYSLATVVYEMLAGEPPYSGPTPRAVIAKRWSEPIPRITTLRETVPAGLEKTLVRALAKAPADRFQTVESFATALERGGGAAFGGATGPTPRRPARRRLVLGGVALGGALAVGAVAWLAIRPGAGAAEIERIAVLPLQNRMADPTVDYLVDGMHEALISELAELGPLSVIARTSTLRYAGAEIGARAIGRELDADALVEGSVFQEADGFRLSVHLIDAETETDRWREDFRTDLAGAVALQREVARAIARAAGVAGDPVRSGAGSRSREADPAVVEAYLKGRYQLSRGGMRQALEYFRTAIARDSTYAPALAEIAVIHANSAFTGLVRPQVAFDSAKLAAERAIALDESLAEAHAWLGYVLGVRDWDWDGAEREFRRALELNPSLAVGHLSYAFFLSWQGRHEEALTHAQKAVELDPVSLFAATNVAMTHYLARRYDQAIAAAREVLELEPAFLLAYERLALAHEQKGEHDEAIAAIEAALEIAPGDVTRKGHLGRLLAAAGRVDEARAILDELLAADVATYVSPAILSVLHLALGDEESALDWLETAYRNRAGELTLLKVLPLWDPLRSRPRFQEVLRRMDFQDS